MRKPIIIGNWKMNKNIKETIEFINNVDSKINNSKIECGIAVNFISLNAAILAAKNLIIAGQNCYYEDNGAFTGEISPLMLKDIKVNYCIIGHSERRTTFKETDTMINLKLKALLKHHMIPILCCGETLTQYESKRTKVILAKQIKAAFKDINASDAQKVIIAYEPIWAIGTGKTASAADAQSLCHFVRQQIAKLYNDKVANTIRIQYGGSVKPENINSFLEKADIDGALVGGASLEADSFLQLIGN